MKGARLIASGLGTGYTPIAPGTAGALLGVIIIYCFNLSLSKWDMSDVSILLFDLLVILITLFIGVRAINSIHDQWKHDASQIVIDEIVGVWIAVLMIPMEWKYYLYGFILFRFFDIAKPLLIRKIDQLKNNWSVMLDDVLAGVYSNIVLLVLIHFDIL